MSSKIATEVCANMPLCISEEIPPGISLDPPREVFFQGIHPKMSLKYAVPDFFYKNSKSCSEILSYFIF